MTQKRSNGAIYIFSNCIQVKREVPMRVLLSQSFWAIHLRRLYGIMAQDKTLTCRDCGAEFIFSASEQEFFESKGFTNEPGRCYDCRAARKQQNNGRNGGFQQQEMHDAVFAQLAIETKVRFPSKWRSSCILQRLLPRQQTLIKRSPVILWQGDFVH